MKLTLLRNAALILIAVCAGSSVSAQGKRPITLEDVWAVKRVGAPSLDPTGAWVAVEVTTFNMEENSSASDIWLLSTDGKTQRQLTSHTARDSAPQWSPDGKWVAFTSRREGDDAAQIYVISPAGGEARRVTRISTGASAIKWLADGKRIAFISQVWPDLATDADQARRARERAAAKVKAVATEQTMYRYWDRWISDGRVPHVFIVNAGMETGAAAEAVDVLAGTGLNLPLTDVGAGHYDFSPDGTEVAFVADLSKDPGFDPNADIIVLNLQTKKWKNITEDNKAGDSGPVYSPDGKTIAYERTRIPRFEASNQVLTLYDRASGTRKLITDSWDRSVGDITWAPDGKSLYFAAEDKARVHVWNVPLSGGEPKIVAQGGTVSGFQLSNDGRALAYVHTTMGTPPAIHVGPSAGGAGRKIESFNDALAAQWKLGEVKDVMFKGWNDEQVHMYVIYPPDFHPKKKWPLLHAVHGGPHGAWLDQFHFRWNMHLLASRGYVVAAVNFHGSTGWGEKFTDSITGRFGEKELADTERASDYLIAQGYIDAQRLAAAGGSFGGFMVAYMNGKTDRYKAYVCHAGVFDYPFQQTASDSVRSRDRALGGWYWENPEIQKQSARNFAANMKTPTLVIHGELDYRVPISHGFAYYATLKMKQVPTRLVYFPDENHWILKPQNSRLWHQEVFMWLEKYAPAGGR